MRYLSLLLACLVINSPALALETGQVDYPYLGFKFTIPEGWYGQEQDDSYLIQSQKTPGLIVLFENPARAPQQLKQEADRGIFTQNVQLKRSSDFDDLSSKKEYRQGLGASFSGRIDGVKAKAYIIGLLNPFGPGVTIAAATSADKYSDEYKKLAQQLANSIVFSAPKVAPKSVAWEGWLQNARLTYLKSTSDYDSGSSTKRVYDFCRDHTFSYYSNSHSSFDASGGFGFSQSSDIKNGRWKIATGPKGETLLQLAFDNGKTASYTLEDRDGKTYLGNTRYFYGKSDRCR